VVRFCYVAVVISRFPPLSRDAGRRAYRGGARCLRVSGFPAAVQVAAPPPAEPFRSELPLQQHQAPHLGAVPANVRFDAGGQLADGGQVDAEQLRAPLQRRRDRPAHLWVVPRPHRSRLPEQAFEIESRDTCHRRVMEN
jgi:hypothetical protein